MLEKLKKPQLDHSNYSSFTELRLWFVEQALPVWDRYGIDREHGGFFERLHTDFVPSSEPRRARVVARQIYWFAAGEALGWNGPVENLIDHGLQFLRGHLVTSDGHVYASCNASGDLIDTRKHLYDAAFVLIALAKLAQRKRGQGASEIEKIACLITLQLNPHRLGGYIDEFSPGLQYANPHMHLFEAFLAWTTVSDINHDFWCQRASSLGNLALENLILSKSGLIPEHFDKTWLPLRQRGTYRIEPGHQFEWSWLLIRWAALISDSAAAAAATAAALRMSNLAEIYGVDLNRNVVIESITEKLQPSEYVARLWQQTERLKAWHIQALLDPASEASVYRNMALKSLLSFLSGPVPGLWFDEMTPSGTFASKPVKASSGYHIACAIEVLFDCFLSA